MLPRDVISTGDLILRAPCDDDVEAVVRTGNDPVTARFLPLLPQPYTAQDAREWIRTTTNTWEAGGADFVISDASGGYLGAVGLSAPDRWGGMEVGYLVAPWARGRGVAARAARAAAEWAFDNGVHRLGLNAEVENVASVRTALAAGFTLEGVQRDAKRLRDGRRTDWAGFARLAGEPGLAAEPYLPFFDELSDGAIRLVAIGPDDAEAFKAVMEDEQTARYSVMPVPPLPDIVRRMRNTGFWWATGQRVELAIRDAATGEFAGHIQLANVARHLDQAMVGYCLLPAFRGRGFVTRAVRLLVDWAFTATPLHRIIAGTDVTNEASHRVLERAGFTREFTERELFPRPDGTRSDDVSWLRLRTEHAHKG